MTAPAYDENNPRPYVDAMITAAFDAARYVVTAIEHDADMIVVHAIDRDANRYTFDCETTSDGDCVLTFADLNDADRVVTADLFPDE